MSEHYDDLAFERRNAPDNIVLESDLDLIDNYPWQDVEIKCSLNFAYETVPSLFGMVEKITIPIHDVPMRLIDLEYTGVLHTTLYDYRFLLQNNPDFLVMRAVWNNKNIPHRLDRVSLASIHAPSLSSLFLQQLISTYLIQPYVIEHMRALQKQLEEARQVALKLVLPEKPTA